MTVPENIPLQKSTGCKRVLISSKYMEENMTCVTNRRIGLSAAIGVQTIENY